MPQNEMTPLKVTVCDIERCSGCGQLATMEVEWPDGRESLSCPRWACVMESRAHAAPATVTRTHLRRCGNFSCWYLSC